MSCIKRNRRGKKQYFTPEFRVAVHQTGISRNTCPIYVQGWSKCVGGKVQICQEAVGRIFLNPRHRREAERGWHGRGRGEGCEACAVTPPGPTTPFAPALSRFFVPFLAYLNQTSLSYLPLRELPSPSSSRTCQTKISREADSCCRQSSHCRIADLSCRSTTNRVPLPPHHLRATWWILYSRALACPLPACRATYTYKQHSTNKRQQT